MLDTGVFIAGYAVQMAASALLLGKIAASRSIFGLSVDTQVCLAFSTLSRVYWSFHTRLVASWAAYFELAASAGIHAALAYYCAVKYRHTATRRAPAPLRAPYLVPASLALAVLVHPGAAFAWSQIFVAFTIYLESVALLPQLYMMRRVVREVEPVTSRYVSLLVLSRVIRVGFWVILFFEGQNFYSLLAADVVHTLLAADFLNIWLRKLRGGEALIVKL